MQPFLRMMSHLAVSDRFEHGRRGHLGLSGLRNFWKGSRGVFPQVHSGMWPMGLSVGAHHQVMDRRPGSDEWQLLGEGEGSTWTPPDA